MENIYKHFGTLSGDETSIIYYDIDITINTIVKFAYNFKYKIREFCPESKPDFRDFGYHNGYVWVFNPNEQHGSFHDVEYTRKWRYLHELAHALSYDRVCRKYEIPFIHRGKGRLEYVDAVICMDWEIEALKTQYMLMGAMGGTKPTEIQKAMEVNTLAADLIQRCVTGEFSNPDKEGFVPNSTLNIKKIFDVLKEVYDVR